MSPSAPRVCSQPGGQKPVLSLSLDCIAPAVLPSHGTVAGRDYLPEVNPGNKPRSLARQRWHATATPLNHLSQCWPRSLSPYGVTRPQWVKIRGSICHEIPPTLKIDPAYSEVIYKHSKMSQRRPDDFASRIKSRIWNWINIDFLNSYNKDKT